MVRLLKALPPLVNCCCAPVPLKITVPPLAVKVAPALLFQLPDTYSVVGAVKLLPAKKVMLATCKLEPLAVTLPAGPVIQPAVRSQVKVPLTVRVPVMFSEWPLLLA